MNTRNIVIPTVCAIVLVIGGYFVLNKNKGTEVKDTQTSAIMDPESGVQPQNLQTETAVTQSAPVTSQPTQTKKIMYATLNTNKGNITLELFTESTPKTVANFVKLAQAGFYDGTKFHRVIKGFMSQGGDPLSKDDEKMNEWGTGGPGYTFNDEIGPTNSNQTNTISMANAGPNTNGSQFFINAQNNDFLNTKHTVFGKVIEGADVALAINSVATVPGDRPVEPVIIQSVTLK